MKLSSIKNTNPSSVKERLIEEYAIEQPVIEVVVTQEIDVFDPRQTMDYIGPDRCIQIRRIIKKAFKNPETFFHIVTINLIEVVKEYSYEEWDSPLKKEKDNVI